MNLMKYKGHLIVPDKLLTAVEQHGGYAHVEARRKWTSVRRSLGLPHSTSGGNRVRQAYNKYFPRTNTQKSSNVYIHPSPSLRAPPSLPPPLPPPRPFLSSFSTNELHDVHAGSSAGRLDYRHLKKCGTCEGCQKAPTFRCGQCPHCVQTVGSLTSPLQECSGRMCDKFKDLFSNETLIEEESDESDDDQEKDYEEKSMIYHDNDYNSTRVLDYNNPLPFASTSLSNIKEVVVSSPASSLSSSRELSTPLPKLAPPSVATIPSGQIFTLPLSVPPMPLHHANQHGDSLRLGGGNAGGFTGIPILPAYLWNLVCRAGGYDACELR